MVPGMVIIPRYHLYRGMVHVYTIGMVRGMSMVPTGRIPIRLSHSDVTRATNGWFLSHGGTRVPRYVPHVPLVPFGTYQLVGSIQYACMTYGNTWY